MILGSFLLWSCSSSRRSATTKQKLGITSLKFIDEYDIPYAMPYNNTTVGGLSGIDYDAAHDIYYMICDDRSAINPARFYTANIFLTKKGIDSIHFLSVNTMLQPNGTVYPNTKQDPSNTPDPEAMRYDPTKKQLVWSSEGERIIKGKDTVLSDPSIRVINLNGKYEDSFAIPANLHMRATELGPRQNGVFEGMTFANDYKTLFVSVEEPLYEDGPRAAVTDNNAHIRILKFDSDNKRNIGQYAYKLEPVAYGPTPASGFIINGVPDILAVGNDKLLVIERSFSTGRLACTIKIFLAEMQEATDIINIPSLKENKSFTPVKKKLLLNMDDLGIYIDNIEGVSFGPVLPNGHQTLLFVADNNFNAIEKSQLLLFEIIE